MPTSENFVANTNHTDLQTALTKIHARIQQATHLAQRPVESVQLLAVSKTIPATIIAAAYACGQTAFGENYVQEGVNKIQALTELRPHLTWHFIGPLQSNKTLAIATHFDWVHSIDRLKIAQRLHQQRPTTLNPLQVCVQVNISREKSKSGVLPEETLALLLQISKLDRLQLRGLMAIPAPAAIAPSNSTNTTLAQQPFAEMQQLFKTCNAQLQQHHLPLMDTLSMGMSADLELAIAEGATIIRIGTAIFGTRPTTA